MTNIITKLASGSTVENTVVVLEGMSFSLPVAVEEFAMSRIRGVAGDIFPRY